MVQQIPLPENSLQPRSRVQWRRWLERHHGCGEGVWVAVRRDAAAGAIDVGAAIEEALCFGWLEGRSRSLGEARRLLDLVREALVVPPDLATALEAHGSSATRHNPMAARFEAIMAPATERTTR